MNFKKVFYRITHWETWPYRIKYIPLIPAWLWYCLRSGSWWFFSSSNPSLTFGGFEGEGKKEMYDQLPPGTYPKSIYIPPSLSFDEVEEKISHNNFSYPFAVKPDIGTMGFMFRKIDNEEQLKKYHGKMPSQYIIQELVKYPLEVSVFYYRFPDQQKGAITGFLKKEFLEVKGDGVSTLLQLIQNYDRVQFRLDEMKAKHEHKLHEIISAGDIYILSPALNLSRGGKLVSLEHEKDEKLLKVFDDLSHYTKYFYYGRYDIKCMSVKDLKEGKNYSILEYNGSGAGNISTTKKFEDKVSLWLFHGSKDDVIPVIFSRDYYRRLKRADADVKYSEYENVLHNSWVNAFGEPDLLPWLFSKEKKIQPTKQ